MLKFHAVVLGAGGVGKSALTLRFMKDEFVDIYDPTIEETFKRQFMVDERWVDLELLDTAGIEQFAAINEFYLKDADGFVLVYSLTSKQTLRDLETIRKQIILVTRQRRIPVIVVGTKSDLTEERDVKPKDVAAFKDAWKTPFFETSAKRDVGVDESFHELVRQMMNERTRRKAERHRDHERHHRDHRDRGDNHSKDHNKKPSCLIM